MADSVFSVGGVRGAGSRRAFLRAGAAGAMAMTLGDPLLVPALAGRSSPPARAVILLWLWGGPSHLDTFDMKPDAPAEYRGPFEPIATAVPGIQVCELLPGLARRADRFALLRAMHHESNDHGIAGTIALDREHRRGGRAGRGREHPGAAAQHRRDRRSAARPRAGVVTPVRHTGQPAPPGAETRRRRRGRFARQHVRPVPARLRAGHRFEAARCRRSPRASARRGSGRAGTCSGTSRNLATAGRSAGPPARMRRALRPGPHADRLAPEPGGARRRARAGAGSARLTGRTASASAA